MCGKRPVASCSYVSSSGAVRRVWRLRAACLQLVVYLDCCLTVACDSDSDS
jgi:hypothetical protein